MSILINTRANLQSALMMLSELEGNQFKSRAYHNAVSTLCTLNEYQYNLRIENHNFTDLPGIGTSINAKIFEFLETGKINKLEELLKANEGYLDSKMFKVRKSFTTKRLPYNAVLAMVDQINYEFRKSDRSVSLIVKDGDFPATFKAPMVLAGSMRRHAEYIADIDVIVFDVTNFDEASAILNDLPYTECVSWGDTKRSWKFNNPENTVIELNYSGGNESSRPFQLLHHTGSAKNNIAMRARAKELGYTLNQYGLYDIKGNLVEGLETEESVYNKLGMTYLTPEQR